LECCRSYRGSLQESIHGDVFHIEIVAQNTQYRIFADIQHIKTVREARRGEESRLPLIHVT